jgi:hypothetical protein
MLTSSASENKLYFVVSNSRNYGIIISVDERPLENEQKNFH